MDYAPDFRYYVSDIGRMWPVSGTYKPWQRELLQIILEYRNTILDILRPGITTDQVLEEAKQLVDSGSKEITLLGQNVNAYDFEGLRLSNLILEPRDFSKSIIVWISSTFGRLFK